MIGSREFRLVLALTGAVAIVVLLECLPAVQALLQPLQLLTANSAYVVVRSVGLPVALDNVLLTHPSGFRVAISYGCTPFVPAIFVALLLTFGLTLSWRSRLIALLSSMVLLICLNLLRVTALYYIGVAAPGAFDVTHNWLGQLVTVLGTAAIAVYWIDASVRSPA